MKFEKRDGVVCDAETGRVIIGADARLKAAGLTRSEIDAAFRVFDEPERPELPECFWWAQNDPRHCHGEYAEIYRDGRMQLKRTDLTVEESANLCEARRRVVEYNARKLAAEKLKPDVAKLVLDDTKWCTRDSDGRTLFWTTRKVAVEQCAYPRKTLNRVWLEPVEDGE